MRDVAVIVSRADAAFSTDASQPPPLSLRGANAIDSYDAAPPFDPETDRPTDAYLEQFAFWGIGYLDAQSWRHYLPRLVRYVLARPDDPKMVTEALIRSLRPPDRYPPRLGALTREQEDVLRELLEVIAQRMAAMQAMLNSMTPEQRAQLQQLSDQLLDDMDLRWQMDQLSRNLQGMFPQEGWGQNYQMTGSSEMGMGEAMHIVFITAVPFVVLAFVIDRERVSRWQAVGLVVGVGALALVSVA